MSTRTVSWYQTKCSLLLASDGLAVWPLTACCERAAVEVYLNGHIEPATVCQGCFADVGDGYALGAFVGQQHFRRDCRLMIEALTDCRNPGECATELVAHYTDPGGVVNGNQSQPSASEGPPEASPIPQVRTARCDPARFTP
jgi:hypothetical protein